MSLCLLKLLSVIVTWYHILGMCQGMCDAMQVLEDPQWPDSIPFREEDFQRYDPSSDKLFYDSPRFVTHIDDAAIAALTRWEPLPLAATFCTSAMGYTLCCSNSFLVSYCISPRRL